MKKFILTAAAAGALALGTTAASAQDLGTVLNNILGSVVTQQQYNNVYTDQYGRTVYVDQYGRHILAQAENNGQVITGYDRWGYPIYNGRIASHPWDRDNDGVSNGRDGWDNRRLW